VAIKTYYLGFGQDGNFGALFDGVAQTAASRNDGWTVGKIASALASDFDAATKQATGTFVTNTTRPSVLVTTATANAFKTPTALTGVFANTAWTFTFAVRAVVLSAQAGRMRMRVYRSVNLDGTAATEITGATQVGTTSTVLSTTADVTTVVTWSPGAVSLSNEYLFFVLAWEITTASGSNTSDVVLRTGSTGPAGTRLVTPDFAPTVVIGRVGGSLILGPAYDSSPTQTVTASTDWVNLANAAAADGSFATLAFTGSAENITFDNFGLTLPPGATVTDITIEVLIGGGGGGIVITPNVTPNTPYVPGISAPMTLYTGTGLWGHPTWTKAEIDNLSLTFVLNGVSGTYSLDYLRVTVTHTTVVRGITFPGSAAAASLVFENRRLARNSLLRR